MIATGSAHKEGFKAVAYDARSVANFILDYSEFRSVPVTNLKLLKLIYFSHGWLLASQNRPLVRQTFEAWPHGPVVRCVWDQFKRFKDKPIDGRAEKIDLVLGDYVLADPNLISEDARLVESIVDSYLHLSAYELSELTHVEGSPWDDLWNKADIWSSMGTRISNQKIRDHFVAVGGAVPKS